MSNIYDLIPPAEMTAVARLLIAEEDWAVNQFQLGRWFPNALVPDIDFSFSTGTDRTFTAESAMFRAFDTPPRLGTRPGVTRVRGELPPISIEYELTEYERIKHRSATRLDSDLRSELEPVVTQDIQRGMMAVERRFEFARRDQLLLGTHTINENGLQLEVDIDRNPARASTIAAPLWSDPVNSTPVQNERAVMDLMMDQENLDANQFVAVMNRTTWRAWKDSAQIRELWDTIRIRPTEGLTDDNANQIRRDLEFPPVMVHNGRAVNPATGVVEYFIPDFVVLYLPNIPIGSTMYGVPAMADAQGVDIPVNQQPGPLAYLTQHIKPLVTSTVIDALGMPFLRDPDATYALTVG